MELERGLYNWSRIDCVRFAVWCARRVIHLNPDPRVNCAVAAIDSWLEDPSEANADAVYRAIEGAIESALEACAFKDKTDAVSASAANAAYAAANAAYVIHANGTQVAHSHAAAAACDSSVRCRPADGLSPEDLLQIYLGEVIMGQINSDPNTSHTTRER